MEINLGDLHFLRPLWLLLALFAALLPLLWRRSRDLQRRLRSNIAAHLLPHLLVTPKDQQRLRPVHWLCAMLIIGAIAAAGPTWEQDRPDFLENRAPLIVAVDLSPSMDASDVPSTRLEAAKHKLHDLIQRRAGAELAEVEGAELEAQLAVELVAAEQLVGGVLFIGRAAGSRDARQQAAGDAVGIDLGFRLAHRDTTVVVGDVLRQGGGGKQGQGKQGTLHKGLSLIIVRGRSGDARRGNRTDRLRASIRSQFQCPLNC